MGFGSPSEYDPIRVRRPLRAAAAFLGFPPLQRMSVAAGCSGSHAGAARLRRFDVLDGHDRALASMSRRLRSWGSPCEAFPSHLAPTRCRVRDESRAEARSIDLVRPLPACRFANGPADESSRGQSHSSRLPGLAPSENPSTARGQGRARPVAPLGLCLSKDFALPATSPSSRAFRSRTWACGHATEQACLPAVFPAGRSAFPRSRPRFLGRPRSGCCPFGG